MEVPVIDPIGYDTPDSSGSDEEEFEVRFEIADFIDENSDEEEIQRHFGGYEYEFVDHVSDSQKCPVCLLPMRDAVQTSECGHRFCKDCLNGILRSDHPVCPNDRRGIQAEGGFFPDKAWARDILCLRVKCKQSERGCDWIGQLRHAETHKDECPYEDEECPACGDNIQRRLLDTHHDEECPKRIIECVFCQDEYTFIQKQQHEDIYCRRFPLICANSCGHERIPREEMEWHLSNKCPMTEVTCPYAKGGCPFQDKRAHLNDHIEASVDDHLELTWSSLVTTKKELDSMKDLRQQFHQMQEVIQKLTESLADYREENRDLSLAVKNLEMQNIQQKKMIEDMSRKVEREAKIVENKIQAKAAVAVEEHLIKHHYRPPIWRAPACKANSKDTAQVTSDYKHGTTSQASEQELQKNYEYHVLQAARARACKANSTDTTQVTSDYKHGTTSQASEQELQKNYTYYVYEAARARTCKANSKDTAQVISDFKHMHGAETAEHS